MALSTLTKAHLGALTASLCWAVGFPLYKILFSHGVQPLVVVYLALLFAALCALISRALLPIERVERKDIWRFAAAAVLLAIAKKFLLMEGIVLTSPVDASLINTLEPVLVLIVSVFFGIDQFTPKKLEGVALGFAGAVMVILWGGGVASGEQSIVGALYVFLGVVSASFGVVWLRGLIVKYRPITFIQWVYPLSFLMMIPFGTEAVLKSDFQALTPQLWGMLAYVVIVPTFLPNLFQMYALHHLKPAVVNIYLYLQPIVAAICAMALHIERVSWAQLLAAAVIFLGVVLVMQAYRKKGTPHLHSLH